MQSITKPPQNTPNSPLPELTRQVTFQLTFQLTVGQIQTLIDNQNAPLLQLVAGNSSISADQLATADNPLPNSLVFIPSLPAFEKAVAAGASIIILSNAVSSKAAATTLSPQQALFSAMDIPSAMAAILPLVDQKHTRFQPGISPRASVAASAQLGNNISIGDFAVVGENVQIGNDAIIGSHCVLEPYATVGNRTLLHPFVFIGSGCQVGDECEIHPHTTIGSDGFSFAPQKNKTHHKIPQLGIVVVESHVEIGANCAIDRATLKETRICTGTKMDNHIHIAHNVIIGKNSRITAGFVIAGSSKVGENFLTGGNTSVTDHVEIASNVMLAGRSVVTKDIPLPGAYGGYPLEPLKSAMKTIANLGHLTEMRRQLHEIRKHLGLIKTDDNN